MKRTLSRSLLRAIMVHVNETGAEVKDANVGAGFAHVIAQGFRIPKQSKLRSAIRRHVGITMLARLRGNVNDVAKVVRDHVRQRRADELHYTAHVCLEYFVPTSLRNLFDSFGHCQSRSAFPTRW